MVGSAIESILSSVGADVTGGTIPDRRGAKWVIYNMISVIPHNTKSGVSDYDKYRFQLDIYARTYSDCDTLAASVMSALDNYSGTSSSVTIDHTYFDGQFDAGPEFVFGEDNNAREDYFRRVQEYIICVRP